MLSTLTVPGVAIGVPTLKGVPNVVYVAGSGDHVFALDGETGEVLWTRSFRIRGRSHDGRPMVLGHPDRDQAKVGKGRCSTFVRLCGELSFQNAGRMEEPSVNMVGWLVCVTSFFVNPGLARSIFLKPFEYGRIRLRRTGL